MDFYRYNNCSQNKKNVLWTIYNEKEISRSELMKRTGLSPVSLSKFISEYITDGIVQRCGSLESTGGRRPEVLRINPSYAYIIGVDIGAYSCKIGIVSINGSLVEKEIIHMKNTMPAEGFTFNDLCFCIDRIIHKYKDSKILGIGFGISGMVEYMKGKVIFCPNIKGWDGLDVRGLLQDKYGIPVFLDTSSRCMALAEQWFGTGRSVNDQIFVSIGYSIGAGVVINSRMMRGSGGFSGELGHVQVDEKGQRCSCGNYGCLELYVTIPMLLSRITFLLRRNSYYSPMKVLSENSSKIDVEMVKEALEQGDKQVYEVLLDTGRMIGIVLSNMSNIINPELVVLGGGVIENFPLIVEEAARTVKERSLITIQQNLSVKKSALGWDSPVIGSAVLVIEKFLAND